MMRKFFNTQLINAGMPEEIREHMMGHTLKDKVREAYFLADPTELQKVYLTYMSHVTIEKKEINNDRLRNDQEVNNAKIKELKIIIKQMKKQLNNITV